MKSPNKREPEQIVFNLSSDIDIQDLISLYKKCTAKPYSFLVTNTTLASDKNLLESIWKLIIKIDDKIRD